MSRGLEGPGPHDRMQPSGRRTSDGARVGGEPGEPTDDRAVLSMIVVDEPGVLAKVTSLFARRQINIERVLAAPTDEEDRTRITFVVEPPHPGIGQVTKQLEKLLPVVSVNEHDERADQHLAAQLDEF